MDQWKPSDGIFQASVELSGGGFRHDLRPGADLSRRYCDFSQKAEQEVKESVTARKVQKADREKLRRDRLNEQFLELGKTLDPDRPKNDKATILADTIQMLKDLTAQVNRLKTEYTSLSEESRELAQEKNELREEKSTLKSDIDSLNAQYQQRLRASYPWFTVDHSVVMGPPSYPFPMSIPIPTGAVPIRPPQQPYHFFPNQSPATIPNPYSMYVPYSASCNIPVEHPPNQQIPGHPHPSSNSSHFPNERDFRSNPSDSQPQNHGEKSDKYSDVATDLELKTPGSAVPSSRSEAACEQELCSEGKRGKQWPPDGKSSSGKEASCSSKCSSSSLPDTACNSHVDGSVTDDSL